MSFVQRFLNQVAVWYFCKDLPDLEDIPASGHGEWIRYPEQIETEQMPVVPVKPVLLSARQRAQLHQVRAESLKNARRPSSTRPVNTGPISQLPGERHTDVTLAVPALTNKLIHERHKQS